MSIKFLYSSEKTNSYRPTPWHWSTEKFPAYRGNGWRHRGFLAVAKDYPAPLFTDGAPSTDGYRNPTISFEPSASKLIKTQAKGTLLLVPCESAEDEQIMLITLRGGFRGGYSRIKAVGCEVLFQQTSGGHCVVTSHMIVRLTHPNGYVFAETGRRCSVGLVEIFSWDGYKTFPTEEFEVWRTSQAPNTTDESDVSGLLNKYEAERKAAVEQCIEMKAEADAKAKAEAEAEAARKANAERMRPVLLPRLRGLSERRKSIGLAEILMGEEWFCYSDSSWGRREYTEAEVEKTESELVDVETKYAEKKAFEAGVEELKPRMESVEIVFNDDRDRFVAREKDGYNQYFSYTSDDFNKLREFVEQIEAKAAEAEAQAKAEAKREQQEREAAATGLPSDVEIWKRRGGATNAGDGWVITPDGMPRKPDEMRCPRPRYPDEGTQVWRQILPGELVLQWAKSYTAAPHEFEVIYRPKTITEKQLRLVELLQEELAEAYEGARGMSSGDPSPSIGDGWGLLPKPIPVSEGGSAASAASLQNLAEKFKK